MNKDWQFFVEVEYNLDERAVREYSRLLESVERSMLPIHAKNRYANQQVRSAFFTSIRRLITLLESI